MYGFYRTRDKVETPITYVFFSLFLLRNVIYIFLFRGLCARGERRRYNCIIRSKAPSATANVVNNSRTERVFLSTHRSIRGSSPTCMPLIAFNGTDQTG